MATATTPEEMTSPETANEAIEPTPSREEFVRRLQDETAAIKLRRRIFGNTRSLDQERIGEIAERYGADAKSVRSRKVLLNRKDPRLQRCFSICDAAVGYWKASTVPYSQAERGVRLIKRSRIDEFEATISRMLDDLAEAAAEADEVYRSEILPEAESRLGELFNAGDYPATLIGEWGFDWEYPSLSPPEYLEQLNPELYAAEQARIQARFAEALQAAEDSFADEFAKMLKTLAERLTPDADGKTRIFQASSLTKLQDFFGRFQELSIGSNQQMERLVEQAKGLLAGKTAPELRKNQDTRETIAESMQEIYGQVAEFIEVRPDRQISLHDEDE